MKRIKLHFFSALTMALLALTATAHDFEVDGIYYNINGTEAAVTYRGTDYNQFSNEYSGNVTIPATVTYNGTTYSVTTISAWAFYGCPGLMTIDIPNSVTAIGFMAFFGCSGLAGNLIIPNSVYFIFDYAFGSSGLTSIFIPKSVSYIGHTILIGCDKMAQITIENANPKYDSRDNCNAIIETASNTLISGCMNTTIPNSVTTIGENAFNACRNLTSISIPNSITTISDGAFSGCI